VVQILAEFVTVLVRPGDATHGERARRLLRQNYQLTFLHSAEKRPELTDVIRDGGRLGIWVGGSVNLGELLFGGDAFEAW